MAIEQSKVEAWSRQEGQEATREQAPTADATLQIASPQRVRLEEEVRACTCLHLPAPTCLLCPTLPHPTTHQAAPSKVEMKADLLDDTGKRSTVLQRQCCVIA